MTPRQILADLIVIPHSGDLVEWADGKLKLPYSVRYPVFMAGESPWLLEPMRRQVPRWRGPHCSFHR
jgi:hypothetical protein